jgi:curved DNA-binding protein CbpA
VYAETTELEGDADDEQIKISYRRLAKFYHPDGMYLNLKFVMASFYI